jgi:hypothetical protein
MSTRVDMTERDWLRIQTHLKEREANRNKPWNRFKRWLARTWDWLPIHRRVDKECNQNNEDW